MKILVVSDFYPPLAESDAAALCETAVQSLRERGHDVRVLTSRHGLIPGLPQPAEAHVKRVLELLDSPSGNAPLSPKGRAEVFRANAETCREELKALRPQLALFWTQDGLTLGPCWAAHVMWIASVHFFFDDSALRFRPRSFAGGPRGVVEALAERTWRRRETVAALSLEHAVCASRSVRDWLVQAGLPVARAEILHPGVDLRRWPLKPNAGAVHHPARLLYMGPLEPGERVEILLQALRLLVREEPHRALLTVAGEGEPAYVERLKREANELGVGSDTLFMGRVAPESMAALYRDHDLFVRASTREGRYCPRIVEAMACGCPVATTQCGGGTEPLKHEGSALIVPRDDPAALSSAVFRLLRNAVLRGNLVRSARRLVDERCDFRVCMEPFESYLRQCAERG
ncbi:MAG: glycosyltransferase family 4 protein [Candidatus Sumerlaeota bacterium]|nr:glycosyltransferase family 4 protein [Candidatus Sumerlaeota bacterium]